MSEFKQASSGTIIYVDGRNTYSILPTYNVFPHPERDNLIVISPNIQPGVAEKYGFVVDVNKVTLPVHTSRSDLIEKLAELFSLGRVITSGVFSLPDDRFFDNAAARDAAIPSPQSGEYAAVKQPSGLYVVQKYGPTSWVDQLTVARGPKGEIGLSGANGVTPHIGPNGNWFIGTVDTGTSASGGSGTIDPSSLIDDAAQHGDKTYSSNKIEALQKSTTRFYGDPSLAKYGRVVYSQDIGHWVFQVKQPDGSWVTKTEIGDSIIVDTLKFVKSPDKPPVAIDQLGMFSKIVSVPSHYESSDMIDALRVFFVLPDGTEVPMVGVFDNQLRIPQSNGSNEYAAFKSEITGEKLVQAIDRYLGNSNWQQGGGTTPPQHTPFDIYYGWLHTETLALSGFPQLSKITTTTLLNTLTKAQQNPPNYFYIALPTDKAEAIHKIIQKPGTLGSLWTLQPELTFNMIGYRAFRSTHRFYDNTATFEIS